MVKINWKTIGKYALVYDIGQSCTIVNTYFLAKYFPNFFKHAYIWIVGEASLTICVLEVIGIIWVFNYFSKKWLGKKEVTNAT